MVCCLCVCCGPYFHPSCGCHYDSGGRGRSGGGDLDHCSHDGGSGGFFWGRSYCFFFFLLSCICNIRKCCDGEIDLCKYLYRFTHFQHHWIWNIVYGRGYCHFENESHDFDTVLFSAYKWFLECCVCVWLYALLATTWL